MKRRLDVYRVRRALLNIRGISLLLPPEEERRRRPAGNSDQTLMQSSTLSIVLPVAAVSKSS